MRIMVYSLPFIVAQSAPFATLVGFLMSLGGMMSSNEILIFRASGFSFLRILVPVASLGLIISIGSSIGQSGGYMYVERRKVGRKRDIGKTQNDMCYFIPTKELGGM